MFLRIFTKPIVFICIVMYIDTLQYATYIRHSYIKHGNVKVVSNVTT